MPSNMTYSSLITDLQAYLERYDATVLNQTPRFIMLAENRMASELKNLGEQIPVTGNLTLHGPTLPKPAYWRNTISMNIIVGTQRVPLLPRLYEYCRNFWPNQAAYSQPRFYCDYDYSNLLITPTPDQAYSFEMLYFARITPLDSSHQTNWFTDNAPQLLMYACLIEAQTFLRNWDQVAQWQELYDRSMQALLHEQAMTLTDRSVTPTNNG